jgi:riboflavin biosynthesis pyrimidine reductase
MKRAKVIVHMYVSVDGKFKGQEGSPALGEYYAKSLFNLSNANANGSTTLIEAAAPQKSDLSPYTGEGIEYEDWIPDIKADTWVVALDRKGKVGWESPYWSYGPIKMRVVEVVTKQAPKAYLEFLRAKQIPYIIAGENEFDLEEILVKVKKYFKIDPLVVSGGAITNGLFLNAGLVDEISLVVTPNVSGDNNIRSAFDTMGQINHDKFAFKSATKAPDGGVHLIFERK